jgi:hypothetical protein
MTLLARMLVALTLAALPAVAAADDVRPQTPVVRSVAPAPAVPNGTQHTAFGEITRLTKTTFSMRLRTGKTLQVDAASAIASGRYSAPLFVGKAVVVTGPLDAHGTLYAQTVTRMTEIDDRTPRDR